MAPPEPCRRIAVGGPCAGPGAPWRDVLAGLDAHRVRWQQQRDTAIARACHYDILLASLPRQPEKMTCGRGLLSSWADAPVRSTMLGEPLSSGA